MDIKIYLIPCLLILFLTSFIIEIMMAFRKKKNKIKAIIFDFDGVILDSTKIGMKRHIEAAKELNIKEPSIKLQKEHWGGVWKTGFLNAIASVLGWTNQEKAEFKKLNIKKAIATKYKPIPELNNTLNELHKKGIILTIVSSRNFESMRDRLKEIKIAIKIFDFIQTRDRYEVTKPDPRVFNPALDELKKRGIIPNQIVSVGDTINYDCKSAKDHVPKIQFIGITSGAATKQEFIDAGVNSKLIIESVAELPKALKNLNK